MNPIEPIYTLQPCFDATQGYRSVPLSHCPAPDAAAIVLSTIANTPGNSTVSTGGRAAKRRAHPIWSMF